MACASHHMLEDTRFSTVFSGWMRASSRCDVFRDELNRMVPVKNLYELRWYGGCHYTREREMGILTISQKTFADELVKTFCVTSTQSIPL